MKRKQNIYYFDEVRSIFMTQETSGEFFKYSFIINQKLPSKHKDTVQNWNKTNIFYTVLSFCGNVLGFKVDKCPVVCSNA